MRKAKISVASIWGMCPYCNGALIDPTTNSLMIEIELIKEGEFFTCEACGKRSQLEADAFKLKREVTP